MNLSARICYSNSVSVRNEGQPVPSSMKGSMMSDNKKLLSVALVVFGAAFVLIYPLAILWPSGWAWHEGSPAANDYFMMIVGVYATLGIFMIRAARDPAANASLIWFVVFSSVVHALVMAWEAIRNPMMSGHLYGDVPALILAALILGFLMRGQPAGASRLAA